ncbi:YkoF family thiamine/hydroxymethylpyrimidine-binding protein [Alteromonas gilva]|uniref:YkoF family thiamine/hydroxymethylpyrimidine-binding protein n=1 Tax=Alteromonas gilva TaxID=2987522 RepID=A0ABT5L3P1_9ALTE|nr:YkoF family thiamine/hydroxymethylpyrimidine-binding protein [Alteromonas gilva]MDC8831657.1 YkoF family thiamine/hydroxymethylpyrimidine-binding protein [Alteromonas gilva]
MQVMVELSLYPLVNEFIPPIKAFIERLNNYPRLTVTTCSTSTQVHGDYSEVMQILGAEMQRTHEEVGQAVFVAKFLNYDAMQSRQVNDD